MDTDRLVAGVGAAGARAPREDHDAGLKTTLIVKGQLGTSGCPIFAGNLTWFKDPSDSNDLTERATRLTDSCGRYTHYLGDQRYLQASAVALDYRNGHLHLVRALHRGVSKRDSRPGDRDSRSASAGDR